MPTVEEVELVTKLRDEATAQWKTMVKEFDAGAKQMGSSVVDTTGKLRSHGKEVSNLSKWIREQRTEQRDQNFLFSQGREVIGAASVALTALSAAGIATSGDLKKVSDAANSGFVAFQGFNNVLGFLPGPIGMVASVAGGLAISMLNLGNNTEEAKKALEGYNDEAKRFAQGLSKEQAERERDQLQAVVDGANARKAALQEQLDGLKTLRGVSLEYIRQQREALPEQIAAEQRMAESYTIRVSALNDIIRAEEQRAAVELRAEGAKREALLAAHGALLDTRTMLDLTALGWQKNLQQSDAYAKTTKAGLTSLEAVIDLQPVKLREVSAAWHEMQVYSTEELQLINNTVQIVGQSMVAGMQAAFDGSEGSGKKFMKSILISFIDMVQGMVIAAEAAALSKGVVSWWTTLAKDLPMIAAATVGLQTARAVVGRFHEGGSMYVNAPPERQVPILVRGGETVDVRTERQQAASSGAVVNIYFNSPVSDVEFVRRAVQKGIDQSGLSAAKLLAGRNPRTVSVTA